MEIKFLMLAISMIAFQTVFAQNQNFTQEYYNDEGEVELKDTLIVDGLSKKRLYANTKAWLSKDFVSKYNKITFSDFGEANIIGKGRHFYRNSSIFYDVEFRFVDNKVLITLDDFRLKYAKVIGGTATDDLSIFIRRDDESKANGGYGNLRGEGAKAELVKIRSFFIEGLTERFEEAVEFNE